MCLLLSQVGSKQDITDVFQTLLTTKLVKGDNTERRKKGMMTKQREALPQAAPGEIPVGHQEEFLHGGGC